MTKSTEASSRVTAATRDAAAESKNTIRNTAIGSGAVEMVLARRASP